MLELGKHHPTRLGLVSMLGKAVALFLLLEHVSRLPHLVCFGQLQINN